MRTNYFMRNISQIWIREKREREKSKKHLHYVTANQLTVALVKVQSQYKCAISLEIKYLADFRVRGLDNVKRVRRERDGESD